MAKFIRTFENGETKNELHFKGEVFTYTMQAAPYGKKADKKCFDAQIQEKYGDDDEEVLEAADRIDFGDDDDIEEALLVLSEAERF